jgi:hypothetical protein
MKHAIARKNAQDDSYSAIVSFRSDLDLGVYVSSYRDKKLSAVSLLNLVASTTIFTSSSSQAFKTFYIGLF